MRTLYEKSGVWPYRFTQIMLWAFFIAFVIAAFMTRHVDKYSNHLAFIACAIVMLMFGLAGEWAIRKVVTRVSADANTVQVETMSSFGRKTRTVPRTSVGFGAPGAVEPITRTWRSRRQTILFVPIYMSGSAGLPLFMDVTKDRLQL